MRAESALAVALSLTSTAAAGLASGAAPREPIAASAGARRAEVGQVSIVRDLTLALLVLRAVGAAPEATLAGLGYGLAMHFGAGGVALWTRYAAPK